MKLTVYQYPKCGTCRKALKWLTEKGIDFQSVHIVDHPPDKKTLQEWVSKSGLSPKKFFNTSGEVYKQLGLKDKLDDMDEGQMLELLASNGKLIKRPIVTDGDKVTVGFKEEEFEKTWK